MADEQSPELRPESIQGSLEAGLGGSRLNEYEFAPYGQIVDVSIPDQLWSSVFFSWLSMKGHLQGLHDLERTELFAARIEDRVRATFVTIWTSQEAFAEWLQHGYPVEEMLRQMGVDASDISTRLVRDYS